VSPRSDGQGTGTSGAAGGWQAPVSNRDHPPTAESGQPPVPEPPEEIGDALADDPGARLMVAWCRGDEAAFDRLVELYTPRLWALITRLWGPGPQREDLVQEVFLRLLRLRERYQPTARFQTFLYHIVFNLCANTRAREGVRRGASLDDLSGADGRGEREPPDPRAEAPADRLERDDAAALVRAAIDELPANQRMAVVLARYEELPYAEIAQVLGSSEKAVKSLIHRARERLRARLAPLLEEDPA
jgi:RNA polymerase sigma-70 factor, ECF subfamily